MLPTRITSSISHVTSDDLGADLGGRTTLGFQTPLHADPEPLGWPPVSAGEQLSDPGQRAGPCFLLDPLWYVFISVRFSHLSFHLILKLNLFR